ncbi:MAG: hypothetical protein IJ109_01455 [Firmicutes bacterium]|nr:hypothetical protein [Bacillota bacterium]
MMKRFLPVLIALLMAVTTGFLPVNQASAAVNHAKIPSDYQSGYKVYTCIDISNWQGVISKNQFKKLKAKGVTHVIVRVGYTQWASFLRFADASYKKNIDNAYAAGLKVGAYYYSQAKTTKEAKKEAKKTIKLLKNYKSKITLPVAFDWEWGGRLNARWAKKNGKAKNTKICQAFCKQIKAAGYTPMVYASSSVLINYLNRDTLHKQYKIWVAHYTGGKATGYAKPMYMWQYSSTAQFGKSLTNTTNVDVNYLFVKLKGKWVKASNGKYKYKVGGEYLKSEWLTLDGKTYYLDSSGYRVTGYQKIGDYHYGFNGSGVMYKSTTAKIGGSTYKFAASGRSVLYTVKVVNVSDGLAYRTGPSTSSKYKTKGKYAKNNTFDVVRTSGSWYQAGSGKGNGYWSLSGEDGKTYLKKTISYPQ